MAPPPRAVLLPPTSSLCSSTGSRDRCRPIPRCVPHELWSVTSSSRAVWQLLHDQLAPDDVLLADLRVPEGSRERDVDLLVGFAGHGMVAVQVACGAVRRTGTGWVASTGPLAGVSRPVDDARAARFAVRAALEGHPTWRGRVGCRLRWGHAVVVPDADLPAGEGSPDLPRWAAVDRGQLGGIAAALRAVPGRLPTALRAPSAADLDVVLLALRGLVREQEPLLTRSA